MTTFDNFEGCQAKLERATLRLEELERDVDSDSTKNRFGFRTEYAPDTGERIIRDVLPRAISLQYSVSVGEIIHHLRSSLDHMVWQLVIANGQLPQEGVTGFPVILKKRDYRSRGKKMTAGLGSEASDYTLTLQPFQTDDPKSHPLYILNRLWNLDKHRLLVETVPRLVACNVNYHFPSGEILKKYIDVDGDVADGVELGRFKDPDGYGPGVKITEMVVWRTVLQNAGAEESLLEFLSRLRKYVAGVTEKSESFAGVRESGNR